MDPLEPLQGLPNTDKLWFKDAVFYELNVRSFQDSSGDGIGDFAGLTQRLDYLQQLGIDCLWLMPFYPSPLRDDGYDIADYTAIHPDYGSLADFQRFLEEAHARGLRVIADLVINHTSDQHHWFREALKGPDNPYHNYYVWSEDQSLYKEARIIFVDTERSNWAFSPEVGEFYWHRFFSHQPDLNYDNPKVQEEMLEVVRFWLELGLDGFRVDAVPYLFEREGTSCENLPETHAFLARMRRFVDEHFPGRLLLAEANQWPEDVIHYFGSAPAPEFHMCFNFPLMPRIFMALRREERRPIREIVERIPELREDCQWAIFLRNHDELTLEMVTDEERDYMYREYAKEPRMKVNLGIRRRLAPLLENGRRQLELVHSLILTLPGSPILYYGDEIAMGDNIFLGDRNAVRTPMQWSLDRNAGFSRADTSRLYNPVIVDPPYGYQAVNVEAQERSPTSFLNWLRRIIRVRKQYTVFGRGEVIFLEPLNTKVLAYVLSYQGQEVLIVNNLARFAQPCELDLSRWAGHIPIEMLGNTLFPPITHTPYLLTLGPHSFFWFRLEANPKGAL